MLNSMVIHLYYIYIYFIYALWWLELLKPIPILLPDARSLQLCLHNPKIEGQFYTSKPNSSYKVAFSNYSFCDSFLAWIYSMYTGAPLANTFTACN